MVARGGDAIELRFAHGVGQSRMSLSEPDRLLIGYTRSMLGALVLQPDPLRIGILGLGGGSQVKFCHRHLPRARIEAVEIDPRVIALRGRFRVPPDDARLQVLQGEALAFLEARPGAFDLLLLDCYDADGLAPGVATPGFDAACHAALRAGGVLASNLHRVDPGPHGVRLRACFGENVLLLPEPQADNYVLLAWKDAAAAGGGVAPEQGLDESGLRELAEVFAWVRRALADRPGIAAAR